MCNSNQSDQLRRHLALSPNGRPELGGHGMGGSPSWPRMRHSGRIRTFCHTPASVRFDGAAPATGPIGHERQTARKVRRSRRTRDRGGRRVPVLWAEFPPYMLAWDVRPGLVCLTRGDRGLVKEIQTCTLRTCSYRYNGRGRMPSLPSKREGGGKPG